MTTTSSASASSSNDNGTGDVQVRLGKYSIKTTPLVSPQLQPYFSNRQITLDNMQQRIKYAISQEDDLVVDSLCLNFENLSVTSPHEVTCIRRVIEQVVISEQRRLFPQHSHLTNDQFPVKKIHQVFVNYDNCDIGDDCVEEYCEMVKYLSERFYETVHRYTTTNFLDNLVKVEAVLRQMDVYYEITREAELIANRYVVEKMVGEGTFGQVILARDRLDGGRQIAIKKLSKRNVRSMDIEDFVFREICILEELDHPNIARLLDHFETDDTVYVVMEYCKSSRLGLSEFEEHAKIPEHKAKKYFSQLVDAFAYLQREHQVMHRDIQLDNVCLDDKDNVKVIDFGCADFFDLEKPGSVTLFCGHNSYAAPEMLLQQGYTGPEVDVWSLGVLLFKILTGFLPFRNAHAMFVGQFFIPIDDEPISAEAKDLIKRILVRDVSVRPTIEDIAAHPWVQSARQ